jgi:hypothetical protein
MSVLSWLIMAALSSMLGVARSLVHDPFEGAGALVVAERLG